MPLFIVSHAVYWPETVLMVVPSMIDGYFGADFAQKTKPHVRDHHHHWLYADRLLLCQTVSALVAGFDNSMIFVD